MGQNIYNKQAKAKQKQKLKYEKNWYFTHRESRVVGGAWGYNRGKIP